MLDSIIEKLHARVQELEQFIGQSAGNHNQIIGRLEEAKGFISLIEEVMKAPQEQPDAASQG